MTTEAPVPWSQCSATKPMHRNKEEPPIATLERKPEYSNKELAQPKTKRMHYPSQLGDESQLLIPYHSLTNFITLVLSGLLHVRGQGESWTGPFNA